MKKKIYYVSAHSEIPEFNEITHIPEVPKDTYIIMKVNCGLSSYVKNTSFENRWLKTRDATDRLREMIDMGMNTFINGQKQRIFKPGQKPGPINQVLHFANLNASKRETFFLGIKEAPVNVRKLQSDATERIRGTDKGRLIQVFKAVEERYFKNTDENLNYVTTDDLKRLTKEELIVEIKFMLAAIVNSLDISPEQLETLISDRTLWRLQRFMDRKIPVENVVVGTRKISEIIKSGPGIYIIDACRDYTGPRLGRANMLVPVGAKRPRNARNVIATLREQEKPKYRKVSPNNNKNLVEEI